MSRVDMRRLLLTCAVACLAGFLGQATAWAQAAAPCVAYARPRQALVDVTLSGLFDDESTRLLKLGLEGQVEAQATLWRRRAFFFDERVARQSLISIVAFSRAQGRFVMQGRPANLARLSLPRMRLPFGGDPVGNSYYVTIRVRLAIITATSLGRVAEWMAGQPAPPDDASRDTPSVTRAALEVLANDFVLSASGECDVEADSPSGWP